MALFEYTALNDKGARIKGLETGDSAEEVRRLLRAKSLIVLKVGEPKTEKARRRTRSSPLYTAEVSRLSLAMILRQISTLLEAGIALDEVLLVVANNSESKREAVLLQSWRSAVLEGESLGNAMRKGAQRVSDGVAAAVDVAETTGCLDKVLSRLADEQELALDNTRSLYGVLVYPAVLIFVSISALIFVITNIVPKITSVFASQKADLPTTTRVVIAVSDFLVSYGIYIGVVSVALTFVFALMMRNPKFRLGFHQRLVELPKVGEWIKLANLSDWSRNMSLLLDSGVPLVQSLMIANKVVGNLKLRQELDLVVESVRSGDSLRESLGQRSHIPAFMLHLVGSGERGSQLSMMLSKIATYYSKLLAAKSGMLLKVLNPILLIIIAGVVLVIILGVITPIMQMNNMV